MDELSNALINSDYNSLSPQLRKPHRLRSRRLAAPWIPPRPPLQAAALLIKEVQRSRLSRPQTRPLWLEPSATGGRWLRPVVRHVFGGFGRSVSSNP